MENEEGIDHKILTLPDEKIDPRLAEIKERNKRFFRTFKKNLKNFLKTIKI